MIEDFIVGQKPDVVALGASGRLMPGLARDLEGVLDHVAYLESRKGGRKARESREEPEADYDHLKIPMIYIDEQLGTIFETSERAEREFGGSDRVTRRAVCVARQAQEPMVELASVVLCEEDLPKLALHPLQDYLDATSRAEVAERCVVDALSMYGVDVNRACRSEHSAVLLQFVAGLGKRKARPEQNPRPLFARRTLNATGPSRVTLSLRQ